MINENTLHVYVSECIHYGQAFQHYYSKFDANKILNRILKDLTDSDNAYDDGIHRNGNLSKGYQFKHMINK